MVGIVPPRVVLTVATVLVSTIGSVVAVALVSRVTFLMLLAVVIKGAVVVPLDQVVVHNTCLLAGQLLSRAMLIVLISRRGVVIVVHRVVSLIHLVLLVLLVVLVCLVVVVLTLQ